MAGKLDGKTIAFLATDGVEQVELTEPWKAVSDAGGTPELISLESGEVQGVQPPRQGRHVPGRPQGRRRGRRRATTGSCSRAASPTPTSCAPTTTRSAFVRAFFDAGKPVAAICHGPWTLIDAGVVEGRTLTSWPSLQTDLRNAGATWVDEEVHVDEGLVTSRNPDDLPAFCAKLVEEIAEGVHEGQRQSTHA